MAVKDKKNLKLSSQSSLSGSSSTTEKTKEVGEKIDKAIKKAKTPTKKELINENSAGYVVDIDGKKLSPVRKIEYSEIFNEFVELNELLEIYSRHKINKDSLVDALKREREFLIYETKLGTIIVDGSSQLSLSRIRDSNVKSRVYNIIDHYGRYSCFRGLETDRTVEAMVNNIFSKRRVSLIYKIKCDDLTVSSNNLILNFSTSNSVDFGRMNHIGGVTILGEVKTTDRQFIKNTEISILSDNAISSNYNYHKEITNLASTVIFQSYHANNGSTSVISFVNSLAINSIISNNYSEVINSVLKDSDFISDGQLWLKNVVADDVRLGLDGIFIENSQLNNIKVGVVNLNRKNENRERLEVNSSSNLSSFVPLAVFSGGTHYITTNIERCVLEFKIIGKGLHYGECGFFTLSVGEITQKDVIKEKVKKHFTYLTVEGVIDQLVNNIYYAAKTINESIYYKEQQERKLYMIAKYSPLMRKMLNPKKEIVSGSCCDDAFDVI